MKTRTRIGQWNVRTLTDDARLDQLEQQMQRYKLEIVGLSETRWRDCGDHTTKNGNTLLYCGKPNKCEGGVALLLTREIKRSLMEWNPVSHRILTARIRTRARNVTIVQCYAPTDVDTIDAKDAFYDQLTATLDSIRKGDITILMGDFNAQIGNNNTGCQQAMGTHGTGTRTDNGDRLIELCMHHQLVIGGSLFPHKDIHKYTWTAPRGGTRNQIDHICISSTWRGSLQDVRNKRGADMFTDHELIVATIKLKVMAVKRDGGMQTHRANINIDNLQDPTKRRAYTDKLNHLTNDGSTSWVECHLEAAKQTLGDTSRNKHKSWLSDHTWQLIDQRRRLKDALNRAETQQARSQYNDMGKEVKRAARKDRRAHTNKLAAEAEEAAQKHDMRTLYRKTKELANSGRRNNTIPVEDRNGNGITNIDRQRARWREHFDELLNTQDNTSSSNEDEITDDENTNKRIKTTPPSIAEITAAIKKLKNNKAPGPDQIASELLKACPTTSAAALQDDIVAAWESEMFDSEWKKGVIVKIPKKGDLKKCDNWRGITILNTINKIMAQIILQRITDPIERQLRDEQAGFRANRGCIDQSNTLRLIIEQSNEFNSPLYVLFVDFEKAFDRVRREAVWRALAKKNIPSKIIRIIKALYSDAKCSVLHNGAVSEEFDVKNGVRQGCVLSPLLFITVLDETLREAATTSNGIWWNPTRKLGDLDFADDIALLTNTQADLQKMTDNLSAAAQRRGLRINISKTKALRINTTNTKPIQIGTHNIEDVAEFCYLGSVMAKGGGTKQDIASRIAKARSAYGQLHNTWKSKQIALSTKIKIFKACVLATLLYGSETWSYTAAEISSAQVFVNRCLRRILQIYWPQTIPNSQIYQQTQCEPLQQTIKTRKWRWIGHTLRKPHDTISRQALDWNPQGKRKRGRPKQTWRRRVQNELAEAGVSWTEAKVTAQNRTRWKALTEALCSTRS